MKSARLLVGNASQCVTVALRFQGDFISIVDGEAVSRRRTSQPSPPSTTPASPPVIRHRAVPSIDVLLTVQRAIGSVLLDARPCQRHQAVRCRERAIGRAALDLGYRTTVAAANATRDLPHPTGSGTTTAADVQRATLTALAGRFAVAVPNASAW
jgi:hypothetical protein